MHKKVIIPLVLTMTLAIFSCSFPSSSYLEHNLSINRQEQQELLGMLKNEMIDPETRFAIRNRIASNLIADKKTAELILFLTSTVESSPDDMYNAYWLLLAAHSYMQSEAPGIAAYYFSRILRNCPDLEVRGSSIHLASLLNLIRITEEPEQLVTYYSELITRFSSDIDLGYTYFMLARAYEQLGEWEMAIQTYTQFLGYGKYDVIIPGVPDAYEYAKRIVDYDSSSKDWTFETLNELVEAMKTAISGYNYRALDRYQAKVNFFAMSWKQDSSDINSQVDFQMRDFMGGNRIRYNDTLDASSNPNEAYLRSWGWNQYVSVWYLYFRKVNFPADPEIHGRWEWAGIYYGEKM